MAGRKPKPTRLKLMQGTARKHRMNKREPQPEGGTPPCPKGVGAEVRAVWDDLAPVLERLGVLTVADGLALELLSATVAEWRAADKAIRQHGPTYETTNAQGNTMHRPRPEVAMRSDSARRLASLMAEFGLTPSSRTRVGVVAVPETDPLEEYMRRGKDRA